MNSIKPFEPTLGDVLVVRAMLAQVILPELVGTILDYAEYWARSSTKARLNPTVVIRAHSVGDSIYDYQGSQFLVRVDFEVNECHQTNEIMSGPL